MPPSRPSVGSNTSETREFKRHFKIAIVGAGLVGLVVAALLQKAGFQTTLLERDEELQTIGAGIQMPANMNRVLDELGVLQEVIDEAVQPPALILYSWRGEQLTRLDLNPYVTRKYGVVHLTAHRADLRRILFNHARRLGVDIQMGIHIDEDKSDLPQGSIAFCHAVQRHTAQLEILHADLVIGADGEHSMCREALLGTAQPPKSTGRVANRILIDVSKLQQDPVLKGLVDQPNGHCWLGPDCQVVCYSLKGVFNFMLNHAATNEKVMFGPQIANEAQTRAFFSHWDPRISRLLDYAYAFSKWMLFEAEPIKKWVHEDSKLVLVGDAAHASSPHLAQGAAIGMESAAVLAGLLGTATSVDQIPNLLKRYNAAREPRATHIIKSSKRMEEIYHMHDGPLQAERDRLLVGNKRTAGFPFMLEDPTFQQWLWSYDSRDEVRKVLECSDVSLATTYEL